MKAMLGNIEGYKVNDSFLFKMGEISPYTEPFYFKSNNGQAQEITIKRYQESAPVVTLQYSTDGENWSNAPSITTTGITLQVPASGKLYMRAIARYSGMETGWGYYGESMRNQISGGTSLTVGGNLLSLVTGSNFNGQKTYSLGKYAFKALMAGLKITDASKLLFPTNVGDYWYDSMFSNCTSLVTPPNLPATSLGEYCYKGMFYNCTKMENPPEFPSSMSTNRACCEGMFNSCKKLKATPNLPATYVANRCYADMFADCWELTSVPSILPATSLDIGCYYEMFKNCSKLEIAPELPALTIPNQSYYYMFYGCSKLNQVKCNATTIAVFDSTANWLQYTATSGTFYKNANKSDWRRDGSGIPSGWTVVDL